MKCLWSSSCNSTHSLFNQCETWACSVEHDDDVVEGIEEKHRFDSVDLAEKWNIKVLYGLGLLSESVEHRNTHVPTTYVKIVLNFCKVSVSPTETFSRCPHRETSPIEKSSSSLTWRSGWASSPSCARCSAPWGAALENRSGCWCVPSTRVYVRFVPTFPPLSDVLEPNTRSCSFLYFVDRCSLQSGFDQFQENIYWDPQVYFPSAGHALLHTAADTTIEKR